jgi:adenylyltransferase/sulfurtransferase
MHPVDEKRYARQTKLSRIGQTGQQRIGESSVLIIGLGGLGSPAALYLAAAGVGELVISDFDVVEESNLQRQIIHDQASVGRLKTESARDRIQALNPECKVTMLEHELTGTELTEAIEHADVVLDCSDNFETRFAVNRGCVSCSTPLVSAAAIRMEGQMMCYLPDADAACYQCLYGEQYGEALTCESEGILGPVVGAMGTLQALNALLILTGNGHQLVGKLTLFDGVNMDWRKVSIPRDPECPVCTGSRTS